MGKSRWAGILKAALKMEGKRAHVICADWWLKPGIERDEGDVLSRFKMSELVDFIATAVGTKVESSYRLPFYDRQKREILAQFQAKETTEIPEEVYNEILVEIKKERIENMADLTPDKLRILLRKIKRNDYYEHIPYIINQLNGLPPPIISPEVEEIIRSMFKEIQIPFQK